MTERYESMPLGEASRECPRPQDFTVVVCPQCGRKAVIHCGSCNIQISGCLCTEIERFGQQEAWQKAVAAYGREIASEHFKRMGMWVPPEIEER